MVACPCASPRSIVNGSGVAADSVWAGNSQAGKRNEASVGVVAVGKSMVCHANAVDKVHIGMPSGQRVEEWAFGGLLGPVTAAGGVLILQATGVAQSLGPRPRRSQPHGAAHKTHLAVTVE